jgi:hypothetical protein
MQEVEELPHQTMGGRWCVEVQQAVEMGEEWRIRHRAKLGLR